MARLEKPPQTVRLLLVLGFTSIVVSWSQPGDAARGGFSHVVRNGLPSTQNVDSGKGLTAQQAMMWKYTVRCALRPDQELAAPPAAGGQAQKFRGAIGVAPEWMGGTCNDECREKVSSCLFALSNRTGKHVALSLLSGADKMSAGLKPGEDDLPYPFQEGAFFGNVFAGGQAFACQGTAVGKAAQVKRFCASDPASCSGLARFTDAGRCVDACKMACTKLSDGTQRCAASSCRDPSGHVWAFPITTYLRNQIEANNADVVKGVTITDDGLADLDDGDSATFKSVDFGPAPEGNVRRFTAVMTAPRTAGRIEIWTDADDLIGTLLIKASGKQATVREVVVRATGMVGPHEVTLRFFGGKNLGRLSSFQFR
jgi:hypothetical protein